MTPIGTKRQVACSRHKVMAKVTDGYQCRNIYNSRHPIQNKRRKTRICTIALHRMKENQMLSFFSMKSREKCVVNIVPINKRHRVKEGGTGSWFYVLCLSIKCR